MHSLLESLTTGPAIGLEIPMHILRERSITEKQLREPPWVFGPWAREFKALPDSDGRHHARTSSSLLCPSGDLYLLVELRPKCASRPYDNNGSKSQTVEIR